MSLYVTIDCKRCGKQIEGFHTIKYCKECSLQVRRETKATWQTIHQPIKKERPCIFCGVILSIGRKRFCSIACKISFHKKEAIEKKIKICVLCGKPFHSKSKINIYCQVIECQKILKARDDKKLRNKKRSIELKETRTCLLCRKIYTKENRQYHYCSKKCMKKAKINVAVKKKKERYGKDIKYRISVLLRTRFKRAIKNNSKRYSVLKLIGCSIDELKQHIEKQFQPGMSWDNYGIYTWHIDHIKPCFAFDLTDFEEQKKCFHYSNLQPLWAKDNLRKREKYEICENKENQKIEQEI